MPTILIAPDFTEGEVSSRKDLSPAAADWMRAFISVIKEVSEVKATYWFAQKPSWPRSSLVVRPEALSNVGRNRSLVGFLNFPGIKHFTIGQQLKDSLIRVIEPNDRIIIYGQRTIPPSQLKLIAARTDQIYLIIPDADSGPNGLNEIRAAGRYAKGLICLPWELAGEVNMPRIMVYQGHVKHIELETESGNDGRSFVFVGGVDQTSGVKFLREALELAKPINIQIDVFGRIGDAVEAKKLADMGVSVEGFVPHDELNKRCSRAFAFLNPRDPRFLHSDRNFPSKLLFYMKYCRPIVSTDTLGLPRKFAEAMECEGVFTPQHFADELMRVFEMSRDCVSSRCKKIKAFVDSDLSEQVAVQRLKSFLEDS